MNSNTIKQAERVIQEMREMKIAQMYVDPKHLERLYTSGKPSLLAEAYFQHPISPFSITNTLVAKVESSEALLNDLLDSKALLMIATLSSEYSFKTKELLYLQTDLEDRFNIRAELVNGFYSSPTIPEGIVAVQLVAFI